MRKGWFNNLQSLLERGETEDLESALVLASFHIDHSAEKGVALKLILDGVGKNIPIPYIIGYTLICGVKITISKDVLNPGPETVSLIKEAVKCISKSSSPKILDLCTGSGTVAVTLARRCKGSNVTATDISEKALVIAKGNASENKVVVDFLLGNLFEPVTGKKFDFIVTNPPYVKSDAVCLLPSFVRDFAPLTAIDGGKDGLFFHRAILSQAKRFLHSDGSLFIECEDNQDKDVEKLALQFGWEINSRFPNRHGKVRGYRLI